MLIVGCAYARSRLMIPYHSHMHVESTMLTPGEFGRAAVLCGTTAVFVDPHEIANVMGISGVEYMQVLPWENEKGEPLDGVPRIGTVLWIVPAPFPVVSHFSPAAPLEITGKIL